MNQLKALWASLLALWAGLPHQLQALIVAFASGFAAAAAHAYEDAGFHMSWGELHHLLPTFIAAGVTAARILYMTANRPAVASHSLPPDVPKLDVPMPAPVPVPK